MWTFIAEHIFGILGGLGVLGAVIIGVGILLGGWEIGAIIAAVVNFLRAVVEFLKTPMGQVVAIIALAVLCLIAGDIYRARVDAAIWKQKEAALNRTWQDKINKAAAAFASARQDRDQSVDVDIDQFVKDKSAEIDALQNKVSTYEGKPASQCVLSPADIDSLRGKPRPAPPAVAKPARKPGWHSFGHSG